MNFAILGGGDWGLMWAKAFKKDPTHNLLGIFDLNDDRKTLLQREGFNTFSDLQSALHAPALDAVLICTPPSTHFELVISALKDNLHVMVEKPFASTTDQIKEAFHLANIKSKCLMVNYTFLYTESFQNLKKRIGTKAEEYHSLRLAPRKVLKDVPIIEDLLVHDLSMILNLLPAHTQSVSLRALLHSPVDFGYSSVQAELKCADFQAHILASSQWPEKRREIKVKSGKTTYFFNDLDSTPLKVFVKENSSLKLAETFPRPESDALKNELIEFSMRIKNHEFSNDQSLCLKVRSLLNALHESAKQDQSWVECEL